MVGKWISGIGVVITVMMILVLNTGVENPPVLSDQITEVFDSEEGRQAFWGVYIRDLDTDRVLYRINADKPLIPASNQKLVTTAVALVALGSDYQYQTRLYLSGTIDGDVLQGDLIIRGSGDPTFGSTEIYRTNPLRQWAQQLSEMGITRIEGRLIGDDNVFDEKRYAEGWDIEYLTTQSSRYLGVSTGGLSYRDNVVDIKIFSTRPGLPPSFSTYPDGFLNIQNKLVTSRRRRGIAVTTARDIGTETVVFDGSLPAVYAGTVVIPVTNPTTFTLHNFKLFLEEAGIEMQAQLIDIDESDYSPTYETSQLLFTYGSPPLTDLLEVINKRSNNFYADQVFKTFGWEGSAAGGEKRIKDILSRAGITDYDLSICDGSGLSRKDMITAEAMGLLLDYMYKRSDRDTFLSTLPRGGERRTTLEGRLEDLPVWAKTGSLEYVRSLSGYATATNGHTLAFAFLANNYTVRAYRINQTIDRIVYLLTTSYPS